LKYLKLHPWKVGTARAKEIQLALAGRLVPEWDGREVRLIAAADVGLPDRNTVLAAVVVLTFPDLEIVETRVKKGKVRFPYVPGYLSFREVPALLGCLEKVRTAPDVLMCDAQGLAHPRGLGLATHVGILLDSPVLGCAKSVLYGEFAEPGARKGSMSYMHGRDGGIVGAAVRTRDGVKPVYVSVGNRIDLATSVDLVLACSPRYRIPEPLRLAHSLSVGKLEVRGGVGQPIGYSNGKA
jgi:deoxyribonuclease V